MTLESFLATYGYPAIWIGTFLEGETILVLGGLAAHQGYLRLSMVILSAFAGSLMGDQLFFFLGRRHSEYVLKKLPGWRSRIARAHQLVGRHERTTIVLFRFFYGLRTITPFVMGMSSVRVGRFVVFNALGALLWAAVLGTAGYLFGQAAQAFLGEIKRFEKWLLAGVLGVGVLIWLVRQWRRRRRPPMAGPPFPGK